MSRNKQERQCVDCPNIFMAVRSDALRCLECNRKRHKQFERDYEVAHSEHCLDCHKPIVRRSAAQRCRSCAKKAQNQTRERNPNWKGGRTKSNGYILVRNNKPGKVHPYQGEHIVIWEQTHEQELPKGWNVHHFNGVKDDNRPENLIAMSASDHHVFGPDVRRMYEERILSLEKQLA